MNQGSKVRESKHPTLNIKNKYALDLLQDAKMLQPIFFFGLGSHIGACFEVFAGLEIYLCLSVFPEGSPLIILLRQVWSTPGEVKFTMGNGENSALPQKQTRTSASRAP